MESPMAEATKRGSLSPPSLLSSATKCAKLEDELSSLNVELNDAATLGIWPQRLQEASKDPLQMTVLLSTILMHLNHALADECISQLYLTFDYKRGEKICRFQSE